MSWGAFNICSEGHSIHHNVDQAAGAKYGVRYPYKFDDKGLRFWSTPMGAILDQGRLARSFYPTSWLYQKNESPSPTITFYHGDPSAGGPAWQIKKLNGYDCSPDGDYFASFQNQCDRLWIGQNAKHSYNGVTGFVLDIGTGTWLRPARVTSSNMLANPTYYKQRPFMPPTMPHENDGMGGYWPNLQTKRGMREWVHDGWAYKKATPNLNDHSQHEFNWPDGGDPEWEYNPQWYGYDPNDPDAANPTIGLDKNLLYLVEKRYSHGPSCNGTHYLYPNPRHCNDRLLTDYRPHYWVKTAPDPQQFNPNNLLKSWCEEDEYPFDNAWGSGDGGFKHGWPPYSISCGETAFQRYRGITRNDGHEDEPWYAKTDLCDQITSGYKTVDGYEALCEIIPPNTAFDLIIYLQVVNYFICERELTWPVGAPPYYKKIAAGYFNTKCYCILHQIAPLPPKP